MLAYDQKLGEGKREGHQIDLRTRGGGGGGVE